MTQAADRPGPHEPTNDETPDGPRFIAVCLMFTAAAALHGISRLALKLVPRRPTVADHARERQG